MNVYNNIFPYIYIYIYHLYIIIYTYFRWGWVSQLRPLALQQIRFHAGHDALEREKVKVVKVGNIGFFHRKTIGKPVSPPLGIEWE